MRDRRHRHSRHWFLLALILTLLCAELGLSGFATTSGAPGTPPATRGAEPALSRHEVGGGGPVLRYDRSATLTSASLPAGTIGLTFDDGPDPRWTPALLAVLRRHGARATFFVLGSNVNRYPELTRQILAEGHELGVHTFTHPWLAELPAWRRRLELTLTQNAITAATRRKTMLMRPPYTSTPDALTRSDLVVIREAGQQGYLTVLADQDSRDWALAGADPDAVVRAATPQQGTGSIIMFHDGGGDRRTTVAAVERLLTALPDREFRTISAALGLPAAAPAGLAQRLPGTAMRWAQTIAGVLEQAMSMLLWLAIAVGLLRFAAQFACAWRHSRRSRRRPDQKRLLGPVSVVVPAYNEAATIAATVRSLAASDYPELEIIVVDDGSTDGTSAVVRHLVRRHRLGNVRLLRQDNAGKPAALNTGISAATADLLVLVDGDTVFARNSIGRLIQPMIAPEVGAVSGNTKIANRNGLLGRWQHLEYVIGFNLDRRMFDLAECMPTVPGAIGAFRRQALADVWGVSCDTLAEDTDLTMAIVRAGWRVVYEERAVAWTEAPSSLRQLWHQRYRWCYGTMQAMWKHRAALLDRGPSGRLGRRGLVYLLLFQVLLPLCAPVVDLYAVYGLAFLPWQQAVLVWASFTTMQLVTAAYALHLDGERLTPLWTLPLQQIVYRQLMYLVVLQATVAALLGSRQRWHATQRTGTAARAVLSRGC